MTGTAPDSDTTPATPASVSAGIAPAAGDRTNRTNGNRTTTSVALLLIRLRWTLTIAALRHSPQRIVAMIIAVIGALGLIAAAISGGIALGARPDMTVGASAWNTFHTGVVLGGAGAILAVLLIQLMYVGQASAMDPRKFELFGIPDRELTRGLFAAGLCGIPAISGTLALLAFASAYRRAGGVVVVVALLAAPIAIVVMLALSKAMIALFSALADSRRARGRIYIISMPVFILACQLPSLLVGSGTSEVAYAKYATIVGWTPFGTIFALPFDAADGAWGLLAARLIIAAITVALCYRVSLWCLNRQRVRGGAGEQVHVRQGIGIFESVPDTKSGAIAARLATYLRKDPRQLVMYAAPVLIMLVMLLEPDGSRDMVWVSVAIGGLMLVALEGDGVAYDGLGFTLEVISGVRGIEDRKGRVGVHVLIVTAYLTVLAVACALISGSWESLNGWSESLAFWGIGLGLGFNALGVAEVISPVLMYPIAPPDRPFSTPQGRAATQMLFPLVQMIGSVLLMLPTAVVMAALDSAGVNDLQLLWAVAATALLNGVGVLALGTWLGGIVLDERQLKVLATLRDFASLQ